MNVAFDRAVGLTPTEIRALTEEQFAEVLQNALETNPAELVRRRPPLLQSRRSLDDDAGVRLRC
jgi:hypothetical protein